MKTVNLPLMFFILIVAFFAWSETPHDTYQNQKMDSHLEVASEKHTDIIERLATIETRVTVGVGLGALILGGLIFHGFVKG